MRPSSIVLFESVYAVGIALSVLTGILWFLHPPVIAFPPGAPPAVAEMTRIIPLVSMVIGLVISLLLLYFIARKGSDVARWIFIVLFAIGLVGFLRQFAVAMPIAIPLGTRLIGFVHLALQAVCVWLVFRPDAKPWFRS